MSKQTFKKIYLVVMHLFAIAGFFLIVGYFAVKYGFTNTAGIIDTQTENFYYNTIPEKTPTIKNSNYTKPNWTQTEEWETFAVAISKDKDLLQTIQFETGISTRLLMSITAVEQIRLFTSDREFFKQVFYPLKIMGNMSQFSLGIMGIKPETATLIEQHLEEETSPFYLGTEWKNVLAYPSSTIDFNQARYTRLTDPKNRYYNFLYGALYLKQFITQWQRAGINIVDRPEILGTLYNIGFTNSKPKTDPQVGGAKIDIGEDSFSFGGLVYQIYFSEELIEEFPR